MEALATIVLIGVTVVAGAALAHRLRIPIPLVMLLLGIAVGFISQVQDVQLPSEAVLVLLFLPALLFWESLTTSLRELRRDLRGILLLSTVLVVATAFGVAGIATALGFTWGLHASSAPRSLRPTRPLSVRSPRDSRTAI